MCSVQYLVLSSVLAPTRKARLIKRIACGQPTTTQTHGVAGNRMPGAAHLFDRSTWLSIARRGLTQVGDGVHKKGFVVEHSERRAPAMLGDPAQKTKKPAHI